jgi:hypothetical protein
MIKTFSPVPISSSMALWSSSQIFFAFYLSAPELGPNTGRMSFLSTTLCRYNEIQAYIERDLGPNTGKKLFSEYNTMQIQQNASIYPNPETARCLCHLYGTGPALLRNSCTGTTLNAAQSKEGSGCSNAASSIGKMQVLGGRKSTFRVTQRGNQFFQA